MSATRHGLFSKAFMLCDRCVSNAKCERFKPGSQCFLEQEMFKKIVSGLVEQFSLDNLADKIMIERAAMYLIRIARAEAYEATVGMSDESAYWGTYIAKMDNTVRGLFNDLAISRGKRLQLEKGDAMLVSLDDVMCKFAQVEKKNASLKFRQFGILSGSLSVRTELWLMWENDYTKLRSMLKRGSKVGK